MDAERMGEPMGLIVVDFGDGVAARADCERGRLVVTGMADGMGLAMKAFMLDMKEARDIEEPEDDEETTIYVNIVVNCGEHRPVIEIEFGQC